MDFTLLHHFLSMQKRKLKSTQWFPNGCGCVKLRYPEEVQRLESDSVKTLQFWVMENWSLSEGACVSLVDEARWVPLKFAVGTFWRRLLPKMERKIVHGWKQCLQKGFINSCLWLWLEYFSLSLSPSLSLCVTSEQLPLFLYLYAVKKKITFLLCNSHRDSSIKMNY